MGSELPAPLAAILRDHTLLHINALQHARGTPGGTAASASAAEAAALRRGARPNVLVMNVDDTGYGDYGFNNPNTDDTPHLDALRAKGMRFSDLHAGASVCTPSRSALMTGRYPALLGTQANVIFWDTPWAVPLNHTFLPELLQDAGYVTALFGKWVCRATALPPAAALRGRV